MSPRASAPTKSRLVDTPNDVADANSPAVIDVGATVVTPCSENEFAAPWPKGGCGFYCATEMRSQTPWPIA
jgi:hypothetical protein